MSANPQEQMEFNESSVNFQTFVTFLFAMTVGLLAAVILLPAWLPNMALSLGGEYPKAYWYLARATAFVSMSLLWLSMALGLGITNKMARLWPGAPTTFAIHEYVSLLGLSFAVFHALVLLGDHYINFTLAQVLMPFSTHDYRPFWVDLGQVGVYLWAIVAVSFYVRQGIGQRTWRLLHYASFLIYMLAFIHGISSGTDSGSAWGQRYYWFTGGSLLFLLMTRIVGSTLDKLFQKSNPAQPRNVR